ncbi:hypothetical protein T492DRAFT_885037 [Pavlovales sp. CCMP2436]|nr:hypothetical protein T492DRAFT_885037 [Pavlovales sp. CCMP2436]
MERAATDFAQRADAEETSRRGAETSAAQFDRRLMAMAAECARLARSRLRAAVGSALVTAADARARGALRRWQLNTELLADADANADAAAAPGWLLRSSVLPPPLRAKWRGSAHPGGAVGGVHGRRALRSSSVSPERGGARGQASGRSPARSGERGPADRSRARPLARSPRSPQRVAYAHPDDGYASASSAPPLHVDALDLAAARSARSARTRRAVAAAVALAAGARAATAVQGAALLFAVWRGFVLGERGAAAEAAEQAMRQRAGLIEEAAAEAEEELAAERVARQVAEADAEAWREALAGAPAAKAIARAKAGERTRADGLAVRLRKAETQAAAAKAALAAALAGGGAHAASDAGSGAGGGGAAAGAQRWVEIGAAAAEEELVRTKAHWAHWAAAERRRLAGDARQLASLLRAAGFASAAQAEGGDSRAEGNRSGARAATLSPEPPARPARAVSVGAHDPHAIPPPPPLHGSVGYGAQGGGAGAQHEAAQARRAQAEAEAEVRRLRTRLEGAEGARRQQHVEVEATRDAARREVEAARSEEARLRASARLSATQLAAAKEGREAAARELMATRQLCAARLLVATLGRAGEARAAGALRRWWRCARVLAVDTERQRTAGTGRLRVADADENWSEGEDSPPRGRTPARSSALPLLRRASSSGGGPASPPTRPVSPRRAAPASPVPEPPTPMGRRAEAVSELLHALATARVRPGAALPY